MMSPDVVSFIIGLGPWKWVIVGAILLALELAVPGAFMMWLGMAAVLVGVISFLVDWSWQAQ
jgi:membrane protein implicated in regulation of membrane protease activity